MQGKLCHPENECVPPPEFVFLAFDGKIVQEHGKKKVSENDITNIFCVFSTKVFFYVYLIQQLFMFATLANLDTYPQLLRLRNYDEIYACF